MNIKASTTARAGLRIDGYLLCEWLGSGAEANVYRAREICSGGSRRFKLFGPTIDRHAVRRYVRKLERLSGVDGVIDYQKGGYWSQGQQFYAVTGYVAGVTLEKLAEPSWQHEEILRLLFALTSIVAACHRRKVALGALNAADILMNPRWQPVILDHNQDTPFTRQSRRDDLRSLLPICQGLLDQDDHQSASFVSSLRATVHDAIRHADTERLISAIGQRFPTPNDP